MTFRDAFFHKKELPSSKFFKDISQFSSFDIAGEILSRDTEETFIHFYLSTYKEQRGTYGNTVGLLFVAKYVCEHYDI